MNYTLNQTNKMTWEEFGEICKKLQRKVQELNVKFDAIAPILKNGMISATVIGNKLEIVNIIPIHLKYFYNPTEIRLISPIVKPFDLVEKPKILVVESNTSSGESAEKAYDLLKEEFPNSDLYYATVTRVFKKSLNKLSVYKEVVYGIMTDEDIIATEDEKQEYSLREGITVFPWESAVKELEEINSL